MLNRDSIIFGLVVGLIVPFVGYAILMMLNEALEVMNFTTKGGGVFSISEKLLLLMAVCLNLIPFHYFRNHRLDFSMRGIVFPTLIYVFAWGFKYSLLSF